MGPGAGPRPGPGPVAWPRHHQASRHRRDHSSPQRVQGERQSRPLAGRGRSSPFEGSQACGAFGLLRFECCPPLPFVPSPRVPLALVPGLPHRDGGGGGGVSPPHQRGLGTWARLVRQHIESAPAVWGAGPGEGQGMARRYRYPSRVGLLEVWGSGRPLGGSRPRPAESEPLGPWLGVPRTVSASFPGPQVDPGCWRCSYG